MVLVRDAGAQTTGTTEPVAVDARLHGVPLFTVRRTLISANSAVKSASSGMGRYRRIGSLAAVCAVAAAIGVAVIVQSTEAGAGVVTTTYASETGVIPNPDSVPP